MCVNIMGLDVSCEHEMNLNGEVEKILLDYG